MFTLLASAFAGFGMMFGGLFGGHASTTEMHAPMGSTTAMHGRMASSTMMNGMDHMRMGSSTPMQRLAGMVDGKGVMGVVTGVNGTTITVSGKDAIGAATTTYSVDVSSAKFIKNAATTTISSVAVGDHVAVQGTISGSSVTAKILVDGMQGLRADIKDVRSIRGMMPPHMRMGEGSSSEGMPPSQ